MKKKVLLISFIIMSALSLSLSICCYSNKEKSLNNIEDKINKIDADNEKLKEENEQLENTKLNIEKEKVEEIKVYEKWKEKVQKIKSLLG